LSLSAVKNRSFNPIFDDTFNQPIVFNIGVRVVGTLIGSLIYGLEIERLAVSLVRLVKLVLNVYIYRTSQLAFPNTRLTTVPELRPFTSLLGRQYASSS